MTTMQKTPPPRSSGAWVSEKEARALYMSIEAAAKVWEQEL